MKCLYYLAPSLSSTHTISDDLHAIGVNDWYIHVLSKDEAGLKREKIHSSNLIETSDALAGGLTGAAGGLAIGFLAALLLRAAQPQDLPGFVYALVALFPAGFGLWVGALLRAKYDSGKISAFHAEIDAGKFLFLIYTQEAKSDQVKKMMKERHPESQQVAVDEHFLNPLTPVGHQ